MADKAAEKKSTESKAPKKGGRKTMLLILTVLLIGGAGAGAFYFMAGPAEASPEAGAEHTGESSQSQAEAVALAVLEFEPFVVNLADTDASRFVKTTISLAVTSEDLPAAMEEDKVTPVRLRSTILELLAEQTADQITTAEGKRALKASITERANALLPEGQVTDVLFTDLIVQF